jgi:DHHA1 domain
VGNWVRDVAPVVDGGGGKPDLAQAGGKDASKLPQALETAKQVSEKMLGGGESAKKGMSSNLALEASFASDTP